MRPDELYTARRRLGLTAAAFAKLAGVEGRSVFRWEAGDRAIPGCVAALLDLLLNVPAARKRLGVTLED